MSSIWPPADFDHESGTTPDGSDLAAFEPLRFGDAPLDQPGGSPGFDEPTAPGTGIAVAAFPALPTRWDALDAESPDRESTGFEPGPFDLAPVEPVGFEPAAFEPAPFEPSGFEPTAFESAAFESVEFESAAFEPAPFEPAAFEPTAFESAAFDPAPFEPAAFESAAYDPAPFEPSGFEPAAFGATTTLPTLVTPPVVPSLIDDLQRLCRRLVGVEDVALAIARDALGASIAPAHPNGHTLESLTTAIRRCIELPVVDEARIPYRQHRARLRRDLARRPDRDRAILALRHIIGVPPSAVAARLDVPESQVREVASAWNPADSRVDSLAMLRGIDSWISSDLGSEAAAGGGGELEHLDDVLR